MIERPRSSARRIATAALLLIVFLIAFAAAAVGDILPRSACPSSRVVNEAMSSRDRTVQEEASRLENALQVAERRQW